MFAAGAAVSTAVEVTQGFGADLFLQSIAEEQEVINLSADTGCQFVENYSWYNFINTSTAGSAIAYESIDTSTQATAYFTYCQNLANTNATSCATSGSTVYAAIYDQHECKLNADSLTSTTLEIENESVFSLVYSNSDTTSNKGVSTLYVGQNCEENWSTSQGVYTSDMTQGNDRDTYYTA